MRRIPTWRKALHEEIERYRRVPFSFGADCAVFAADCVRAMTGEDLAADFRGRYRSASGAVRVLKESGHDDLASLVASRLGEVHPSAARVGDVAVIPDDGPFGCALGVVIGGSIAVRHESGIGSVPRSSASRTFRVP